MNLLTIEEAAARYRMDKRTFLKLGVPVYKVSARKYFYSEEELDAWMRSRLQYQDQTPAGRQPPRRKRSKILQHGIPKVLSPRELRNLGQEGRG